EDRPAGRGPGLAGRRPGRRAGAGPVQDPHRRQPGAGLRGRSQGVRRALRQQLVAAGAAHPITKITWDNAVLVSQATAQGMLGLKTGDIVRVEIGDRSVTGPVYVQPGHADDAITISLGYGRKGAETTARGVGIAVGLLRTSDSPWFAQN